MHSNSQYTTARFSLFFCNADYIFLQGTINIQLLNWKLENHNIANFPFPIDNDYSTEYFHFKWSHLNNYKYISDILKSIKIHNKNKANKSEKSKNKKEFF